MSRWIGKVAIVTGAASGIGAATATKLVNEGLIVAGFDLNEDSGKILSEKLKNAKGKFHVVKVDVTKEEELKKAFEWVDTNLGPLHILINCAGVCKDTTIIDGDTQKWKEVFDVNVMALTTASKEAIKYMKSNNIDGHIVLLNSVTGLKVGFAPNLNVYSASKFAVTALAETLRMELLKNKLKIKLTSICPGFVKTNLINEFTWGVKDILKDAPYLNPEDVAETIWFALGTPPHVQLNQIIIKHLEEEL